MKTESTELGVPTHEWKKDLLQFDLASKSFWREKSSELLEMSATAEEEMIEIFKATKKSKDNNKKRVLKNSF